MRKSTSTKSRAGFSLIELVFTLGLLAVASTIFIPLTRWSVTALGAAEAHTLMAWRFDQAVTRLREDIWQARKLNAPQPDVLTLTMGDGKNVTWKIGPGDQLSRDKARWMDLGISAGTAVSIDRNAVRLIVAPSKQRDGKSVSMISETALLTGDRP